MSVTHSAKGTGRVALVILNYNNYPDTVECIDGILGTDFLDIVLVDNMSPDGSGDKLRERYEGRGNVIYIQSGENRGYAAGNNVGIRYVLDWLDDEYICVLNNDTLPQAGMFKELTDCLDSHPECVIVGPVVLDNKPGSIIQSAGADIHFIDGSVPARHGGETYVPSGKVDSCTYISGACMMFRSSDIELIGFIPECYFLFFEETEWCLRAIRHGHAVCCAWSCTIVHKGSATIKNTRGLGTYLSVRNRALFARRNESTPQLLLFRIYQYLDVQRRRLIKHQDCLWEVSALRDGYKGRIDPDFSYVQVPVGAKVLHISSDESRGK
jgi:GT2 family glycosyltransferase